MPTAARTYWLTTPCRIRRKDQSLSIEKIDGTAVHIPVTDVRDIVASDSIDINTACVSLLNQHNIDIHLLNYYGDYTGSILTAGKNTSGAVVLSQARHASNDSTRLATARVIIAAAAHNIRRVIDRQLLKNAYTTLTRNLNEAATNEHLMGLEGNFRRTAWALIDTKLPEWLQLQGRSRRPPANAGNAFISYVNGIIYSRTLSAIRLTPLHSGIGILHSSIERQRHALALDLAEIFKPLFAERLLLRLAARNQLQPHHFDQTVNQASLNDKGRKFVVETVRDALATTIQHRSLNRKVAYDELLHLEALKLARTFLEGEQYKPFRIWW